MSKRLIVQNVRGSFVNLAEPRFDEDSEKYSYSIQCILNKDHPQIKEIKDAIIATAKAKFGGNTPLGKLKKPLRDGDETDDDGERKYDAHLENCFFFNAKCSDKRRPQYVLKNGDVILKEREQDYLYSGAYFSVSVNFYPFDSDKQKGVAAGLNNVMFVKHGERLDGVKSANEDFKEVIDDNWEDDEPTPKPTNKNPEPATMEDEDDDW